MCFKKIGAASLLAIGLYGGVGVLTHFTPMAHAQSLVDSAFAQFNEHIFWGYTDLENYKYDAALARADAAALRYTSFLRVADQQTDASQKEELWNYNKAMQVSLIQLYTEIGHKAHDAQKYTLALKAYDHSFKVNSNMAITRYEQGYTYFTMGKEWEAAKALYEAKRLNAYPAKRDLINPLDNDYRIQPNPQKINGAADGLLKDMNKSPLYPITLNLTTGAKLAKVLVPGIGLNTLDKNGQPFNFYLGEDANQVLDRFGDPEDGDVREVKMQDGRSQTLLFYDRGNFAYIIDDLEKSVSTIQVSKPGYKVSFENIEIAIGDHASTVLKQLGKGHGFEREAMNHSGYKEMLKYHEYGLSFGTSPTDKVLSIVVWKLE